MTLLLVICTTLLLTGIVLYAIYRPRAQSRRPQSTADTDRDKGECCGQHAVCERDSLLAAASREIIYYDDEELDRFRGTPSDGYNDEDADAFREVLYTMRPDDVPGWVRSLQLRGVSLPDSVKDEIILIVDDLRAHPVPKS